MQNRIDSADPTFQRPVRQIHAGEARETSSAFRQTTQRLECFWKGAANDRVAAPHKVSSPLFIFTHTTTSGDSQILHNGNLIH